MSFKSALIACSFVNCFSIDLAAFTLVVGSSHILNICITWEELGVVQAFQLRFKTKCLVSSMKMHNRGIFVFRV